MAVFDCQLLGENVLFDIMCLIFWLETWGWVRQNFVIRCASAFCLVTALDSTTVVDPLR